MNTTEKAMAWAFVLAYLVVVGFALFAIIDKVLSKLANKAFGPSYEYGTVRETKARRDRRTGEVQFVLWKAGEQGHEADYWHKFDDSWWPLFVPDGCDA